MNRKVLVVDDDEKTLELVKLYLKRDGYKVITSQDGIEGLKLARETKPDLIVLDIMLPGMDGIQICRTLREESDVPIIMLTARTTEDDRLTGLDLGADDYMTKPFSPRELAARIRAVLRRIPEESLMRGAEEIEVNGIKIDVSRHEAYRGEKPIDLTMIEFKLLGILAREAGRVFTRAQLIDKVAGSDFEGYDRTIDVHIHNLRQKLEPDPARPRYIKTIYGVGYKFLTGNEDA
jgi:two-component system, OmpR family, alkaline phosphatase synthesis response regulator PhoP